MTDTTTIGAIAAVCLMVAGFGVLAWTRAGGYRRALRKAEVDAQAGVPGDDTPDRYRPLVRLLTSGDEDFLRQHVACARLAAQWKRSQRRIVRLYLKEVAVDFQTLHRQARILVAQAPEQYADLLPLLFKQQLVFWRALLWIELRLFLGGTGLPRVNPETLVGALEAVRREISRAAALA